MFSRLVSILRIPELRNKIILTLVLLAVYRMGFAIPLPFVDQTQFGEVVKKLSQQQGSFGQAMQVVALFSASDLGNATIFGLGIMPYISASIIFQLLGTVYPPLEQLQKEGEAGRKKINEWTRYATVVICLFQSYFWIRMLRGGLGTGTGGLIMTEYDTFFFHIVGTITMTAGTILLMWIGERSMNTDRQRDQPVDHGGHPARMPSAGWQLLQPAFRGGSPNISLGSGRDRQTAAAGLLFVG